MVPLCSPRLHDARDVHDRIPLDRAIRRGAAATVCARVTRAELETDGSTMARYPPSAPRTSSRARGSAAPRPARASGASRTRGRVEARVGLHGPDCGVAGCQCARAVAAPSVRSGSNAHRGVGHAHAEPHRAASGSAGPRPQRGLHEPEPHERPRESKVESQTRQRRRHFFPRAEA